LGGPRPPSLPQGFELDFDFVLWTCRCCLRTVEVTVEVSVMNAAVQTPEMSSSQHVEPVRRGTPWWVTLLVGAVALVVGAAAGSLLLAGDAADPNAGIPDVERVEALFDEWVAAWNAQDGDAIRELMTEDGMAYGYLAKAEGVRTIERAFVDEVAFEMGPLLVRETVTIPVTGEEVLDVAYDVTTKGDLVDRTTGEPRGDSYLEYYRIVPTSDGELKVHHASLLNWVPLRNNGV
jgi:uncharacterized protein (TIGR02246 family)